MLRFSKMADYGVLLLSHWTRNENALVSARELADLYHMPQSLAANLLKTFCKSGLLESQRGLHGGYQLTQSPSDITLLDIVGAIDGPVQLTDCVLESIQSDISCDYLNVCGCHSPLRSINEKICDYLRSLSLSDLAENLPAVPSPPTSEPHRL